MGVEVHEVYCQVSDICRDLKNKYRLQHKGEDEILFRAYFMLDYNKKEIRRACEPLVNKYLYLSNAGAKNTPILCRW